MVSEFYVDKDIIFIKKGKLRHGQYTCPARGASEGQGQGSQAGLCGPGTCAREPAARPTPPSHTGLPACSPGARGSCGCQAMLPCASRHHPPGSPGLPACSGPRVSAWWDPHPAPPCPGPEPLGGLPDSRAGGGGRATAHSAPCTVNTDTSVTIQFNI